MSILGLLCTADIFEDGRFSCRGLASGAGRRKRKIFSDLGSAEGYCICLDAEGKYSLSFYIVARTPPFGVPSVALVSTDKDTT